MNIEHPTSNVQHRTSNEKTNSFALQSSIVNRQSSIQKGEAGDKGEKTGILFRETGIHNFQQYFQRSLALNPANWKKAARRIRTYFPDDEIVMGMVPESNKSLKSLVLRFLAETESPSN